MNQNWQCQSEVVLAFSFLAFLAGALLFTPLWLYLANRFGKRDIWLAWSFSNGVTFLAYAFVGPGDVYLCIIMSIINGAPAGAKFLADAIMADVIDYDEFLTGTRQEATYTMFKGFLPKIAAIPASAIPIALLASFGHVPVKEGIVQPQPQSLVIFIKVMIIYLPAFLSFSAWYQKCTYPLKTTKQNEQITEGIAKHLLGQSAYDPCSKENYRLIYFKEEENDMMDLIDNFPGSSVLKMLHADTIAGVKYVLQRSIVQFIVAISWLFGFLILSIFTFPLLSNDLSYIPVVSIVCFGLGITVLLFASMRLRAALKLKAALANDRINETLLQKMLEKRHKLEKLREFDVSLDFIPTSCKRRVD
eukprot:gb/GEZN01008042.1/.p1 GENE.gb/GEZN01008042.1/~~gb/GEZN01008042.1/.p1  ORF type:complete len:361 (+),score=42.79 gb/GEZN01008042.1/:365-1447(+)